MDESCTLLSEGNISSITNSKNENPSVAFSSLKNKNNDRLVIGHINIYALENKFEPLVSLVKDKLDILLICETKIDDTFPKNQFHIEGYSTLFRRDRNSHGGGLILYLREDISCKQLKVWDLPEPIESIFIEMTIRTSKWLLVVFPLS